MIFLILNENPSDKMLIKFENKKNERLNYIKNDQ